MDERATQSHEAVLAFGDSIQQILRENPPGLSQQPAEALHGLISAYGTAIVATPGDIFWKVAIDGSALYVQQVEKTELARGTSAANWTEAAGEDLISIPPNVDSLDQQQQIIIRDIAISINADSLNLMFVT